MARVVLDASALVALLLGEPGWERVEEALDEGNACVCAVNWGEVAARLVRGGIPEPSARSILDGLEVEVVPLDRRLAQDTGFMEPRTRVLGLSFGDRCCLALAEREKAVALTTDRAWSKWKGKAKVVCIR